VRSPAQDWSRGLKEYSNKYLYQVIKLLCQCIYEDLLDSNYGRFLEEQILGEWLESGSSETMIFIKKIRDEYWDKQ